MKTVFLLLAVASVSILISCTRASKSEVSSLKFDFSKVSQKGGGIIPQSAIPTGSEVCYGVNVIASDLPVRNDRCAPKLGVFAGFISEAKELSVEVPFGKDREVQLYAYLPKAGSTCLDATQSNNGLDPKSIYLVGKLSNILFDQPEMTLAMPVSFPGVARSIYSELNMDSSCLNSGSTPPPAVVDPNAPVVLQTTISTPSITSIGVDESISLSMLIKSPTPVNYLNFSHDGPNGNITGGGSSHMFYACTIGNISTAGHICQSATVNEYYAIKTISVSQWAQNGTYSLSLSVRNSAMLTSAIVQAPTYTITNHPTVPSPVIVTVVVSPDSGLVSGAGGNVEVKYLVHSQANPDFIEKTLLRPDMSIVNGGGSDVSFLNCAPYIATGGHICYGMNTAYWFFSSYDTITSYQANGTYSYTNIRTRSAAGLYSLVHGSNVTFSVAGNITPSIPTIQSVEGFYAFDTDPFSDGIPYYSTSCVRPEGTNLLIGARIKSNSNAPINWVNYLLQGPNSVIMGGGNGITATDLGSNIWQTDKFGYVLSVMSAPSGQYSWNGLSVQNAGDLISQEVTGPSLNLQNSCATTYTDVSSNQGMTCGLTNGSNIKCWGRNIANIIDHGSTTTPRKYPTVVDGTHSYFQVSRGNAHTCAINLANQLFCWGENTYYQLGDGSSTDSVRPTHIDSGSMYSKISAGGYHSCGITISGSLKCWGVNNNGQLGDGTTVNKPLPTIIDGGVSYQDVSAGDNHSCGITTTGDLKCWGYNVNGQVGDGTTVSRTTPTLIDSGTVYMRIDLGSTSTCGITNSNTLKCWGNNSFGQIGDNTTTTRTSPVVIDSGISYSRVAVSTHHTCGITTPGSIKCWGQNTSGELGDGTSIARLLPTLVSGGLNYFTLGLGLSHSCAVTVGGQMKCWGQNTNYQLGNGTTIGNNVPIDIDL